MSETVINISKKGLSRKFAVQALYQIEINNQSHKEVSLQFLQSQEFLQAKVDKKHFLLLLNSVIKEQETIDSMIKQYLPPQWAFSRLGYIERSILRLACCEFLQKEKNFKIIISQYVDLTDKYIDGKACSFINALLDKISNHANN